LSLDISDSLKKHYLTIKIAISRMDSYWKAGFPSATRRVNPRVEPVFNLEYRLKYELNIQFKL
jgi:hypothetical protein